MKKEFREYLKFLKSKEDELTPEDYLFKSQKLNKPYNRVSISRLFSNIYKKFNIYGASHFGRHPIPPRFQTAFDGANLFSIRFIALRRKNVHWTLFLCAVCPSRLIVVQYLFSSKTC